MAFQIQRPLSPTPVRYTPAPRVGAVAPEPVGGTVSEAIAQSLPGIESTVTTLAQQGWGLLKSVFAFAATELGQLFKDVQGAVPALSSALAPVTSAIAAPAAAAASTYTVQSGDSLYMIAQRTLGNGDRWPEIFEANRHQLTNANVIFPGQVLTIPGASAAPAPAPAPSSGDFGGRAVAAGRALLASGYRYTVDLGANYHPVRFQVGCCADFAVDAWARAGIDIYAKAGNPHSCTSLVNFFRSGADGHQFRSPSAPAAPGDMIFFDWDHSGDPDHVAIVTEVDGNGRPTRIVESYDFNLPARERDVTRSLGYVYGYGRA